jgi:hypothetical protein
MAKRIAGAPGRNGLAEAERRRHEHEERLPQWWDADGWDRYRRLMGLPPIESCDD